MLCFLYLAGDSCLLLLAGWLHPLLGDEGLQDPGIRVLGIPTIPGMSSNKHSLLYWGRICFDSFTYIYDIDQTWTLPVSSMIYEYRYRYVSITFFVLKGQCHEIFDPRFFHQTIPPRGLIHGLKPFCTWLRIRRENRFGNRQNRIPRSQCDRGNRNFLSEFPFNIDFF
jgi:hypothetical protein